MYLRTILSSVWNKQNETFVLLPAAEGTTVFLTKIRKPSRKLGGKKVVSTALHLDTYTILFFQKEYAKIEML